MRTRSAELLRRVAAGESLLVTKGGVPAAVIVPASASTRERLVAAGRLRVGTGLDMGALPAPVHGAVSTEDVLSEDRGSPTSTPRPC